MPDSIEPLAPLDGRRIPDALDIFEDPLRPGPCWNLPGGAGKNVFNLFPSKPSPLLELPDPLLEHASPLLNHSESLLDSPKPYLALSNTLLEKPEPQIEILDRSVPLKQHPGRVKESFLTDHGLNNPTPVRSDKLQEPPAPVYSRKPSPSLKRGNLALNTVREVKHARLEPVRTLSCEPVNLDNCDNSLNEAGDTPEEENLLPVRISSSLKLVPAGGGRRKINLLPKELVSSTSNSICPNNLGYYDCCVYLPSSQLLQHWLQSSTSRPPYVSRTTLETAMLGPNPLHNITRTIEDGVDVNSVNSNKQTVLHRIIVERSVGNKLDFAKCLINLGADVNQRDKNGDTPLTLLQNLLERQEFSLALKLAEVLVEAGAGPNFKNKEGLSALSISLKHLDPSVELTRFLLNSGASIASEDPFDLNKPLHILFRTIINLHDLDASEETLLLLGNFLSHDPRTMRSLVISALVAESRFPGSQVPDLVMNLRRRLEVFWTQPLSLATLAVNKARRTLSKNLGEETLAALHLPKNLQNYLKLQCPRGAKGPSRETKGNFRGNKGPFTPKTVETESRPDSGISLTLQSILENSAKSL